MATYNPPTEDLVNFDSSVFHSVNGDTITQQQLDANYLKYPIGQGTETIPDLVVGGGASVGGNLGVSGDIVLGPSASITKATNDLTLYTDNGDIVLQTGTNNPVKVGNGSLRLNTTPIFLDTNNLQAIASSGTHINFQNSVSGSGFDFKTYSGGVPTTVLLITNSATTISTPTVINNLTSTTQPLGTNTTKVATTAFVASAIAAIPTASTIIPYIYGFSPNQYVGASSFFSINFTNGATLNLSTYFTLRVQVQYTWNTTGVSTLNNYYRNYNFLVDFYPNRVPTVTSFSACVPNGTINGNTAFVMTDPTYAPNGRWYWTRNYLSSAASPPSPTEVSVPFVFTSTSQSKITFTLNAPDTNANTFYNLEASVEIINRCSGTTFTSSNVSGCFGLGTSYNSF